MEEYLERGDEEEAKQGKESTEDRNKEQQKVSVEEMRERAMERLTLTTKKTNRKDEQ